MIEVKAYTPSHKTENVYRTASEAFLMDVEYEIRDAVAKINRPNVSVTQIRTTLRAFVSLEISPWKLFRLYSRVWGWHLLYKKARLEEEGEKEEELLF